MKDGSPTKNSSEADVSRGRDPKVVSSSPLLTCDRSDLIPRPTGKILRKNLRAMIAKELEEKAKGGKQTFGQPRAKFVTAVSSDFIGSEGGLSMHSRNTKNCYFQISCKHSTMRVSTWSRESHAEQSHSRGDLGLEDCRQPRIGVGIDATHFGQL